MASLLCTIFILSLFSLLYAKTAAGIQAQAYGETWVFGVFT